MKLCFLLEPTTIFTYITQFQMNMLQQLQQTGFHFHGCLDPFIVKHAIPESLSITVQRIHVGWKLNKVSVSPLISSLIQLM